MLGWKKTSLRNVDIYHDLIDNNPLFWAYGANAEFSQFFFPGGVITWLNFIRLLFRPYRKQRDSSNFHKKNYLNYFGGLMGQMGF